MTHNETLQARPAMTMENDLVERLRRAVWRLSGSGMSQVQFWKAYGDKLDGITKTEVERHEKSRIRALEAELAAALIEVSNQAQLRGEAEGKLHVSELAGIVEGWQLRAERAEAEVREAWNEAQCCDDTPLGQATLAEFIADQHKCRKSAEAELARKTEALERLVSLSQKVVGANEDYLNGFAGKEPDEDLLTIAIADLQGAAIEITMPPEFRAARFALEEKTDV